MNKKNVKELQQQIYDKIGKIEQQDIGFLENEKNVINQYAKNYKKMRHKIRIKQIFYKIMLPLGEMKEEGRF